mmetsp:Transcript_50339/g.100242  ORF Transcript_50339/g.100242 Transcript_50339/m.100242 type:complete len:146 (-) Transcript_50339:591-1028(-)
MDVVAESDQSLVQCFRAQIESHERLRLEHDRLRQEHTAALKRAEEDKVALALAVSGEARSTALMTAMQDTVANYVATCSLRSTVEEAGEGAGRLAAAPEESSQFAKLLDLERRLQMKDAELMATRAHLTERALPHKPCLLALRRR